MKKIFFLAFIFSALTISAQDLAAYKIYNSKGKEVSFKSLVKSANEAPIVLFGEFHDNPIAHWLQLELTQKMYATHGANLQLGFEMFEQEINFLHESKLKTSQQDNI